MVSDPIKIVRNFAGFSLSNQVSLVVQIKIKSSSYKFTYNILNLAFLFHAHNKASYMPPYEQHHDAMVSLLSTWLPSCNEQIIMYQVEEKGGNQNSPGKALLKKILDGQKQAPRVLT